MNNNINYRRMLELSEEFDVFVVSLHTLYLDSVVGFNELHRRLLEHQDTIKSMLGECEVSSYEFQDQCSVSYETLCGERFNVESTSPLMRQGEVKERTARDGINYILMGRLCVVHAFGYWEAYLRAEVRTALGFENSPKNDFWGDMRLLRNAILHNKGKANPDFDKMKVFKWFKPGDQINLDFEKVKMIFAQMANFRNYLHALSLPPHDLRFPSRP